MSHSIHHVPGRLRVRSSSFRCRPAAMRAVESRLFAQEGVNQVRLNPQAGSVTIHYDPARTGQAALLATLRDLGCHELSAPPVAGQVFARTAGEAFGKALLGAFVNKAVERSAFKLVSVLL